MIPPLIDPECLNIRRANFPQRIIFHAPGLRRYQTADYAEHAPNEFIPISLTGTACALNCDHCQMLLLEGMRDLTRFDGTLFELCVALARRGAHGVLISGGSDRQGRVPLLAYVGDLARARDELGLAVRVHPGLLDDETAAALGPVGLDGAMIDLVGHRDTIREVCHLDAHPEDYEAALARLARYGIPAVPHIILGLHYGRMLGEWRALDMVLRYPPKLLVLVILMPLTGTPMAAASPPSLGEIAGFFETARKTLPSLPIMLGCARPLGEIKHDIDRLAVDAGLNGIAYPSEGIADYARSNGLEPHFVNACCGVTW